MSTLPITTEQTTKRVTHTPIRDPEVGEILNGVFKSSAELNLSILAAEHCGWFSKGAELAQDTEADRNAFDAVKQAIDLQIEAMEQLNVILREAQHAYFRRIG